MDYFISHDPLTSNIIGIVRKDENQISFIPIEPMNIDYQRYLLWVEEGNTAPVWDHTDHGLPVVTPDAN